MRRRLHWRHEARREEAGGWLEAYLVLKAFDQFRVDKGQVAVHLLGMLFQQLATLTDLTTKGSKRAG